VQIARSNRIGIHWHVNHWVVAGHRPLEPTNIEGNSASFKRRGALCSENHLPTISRLAIKRFFNKPLHLLVNVYTSASAIMARCCIPGIRENTSESYFLHPALAQRCFSLGFSLVFYTNLTCDRRQHRPAPPPSSAPADPLLMVNSSKPELVGVYWQYG
jgi:hypothetical protein